MLYSLYIYIQPLTETPPLKILDLPLTLVLFNYNWQRISLLGPCLYNYALKYPDIKGFFNFLFQYTKNVLNFK